MYINGKQRPNNSVQQQCKENKAKKQTGAEKWGKHEKEISREERIDIPSDSRKQCNKSDAKSIHL